MKIVKKIFALSTSAILGLSFCAGPVFASRVPKDNSKIIVKSAFVEPRSNGRLRRSPVVNFFNTELKLDDNFGTENFVRNNSDSRSPLIYEDFEKVWPYNLYLSIMESINGNRSII